jgi:hypothetical protein
VSTEIPCLDLDPTRRAEVYGGDVEQRVVPSGVVDSIRC